MENDSNTLGRRKGSRSRARRARARGQKASKDPADKLPAALNDSDNETDWRWMEVCGASSAIDSADPAKCSRVGSKTKPIRADDSVEDGWRWLEVAGQQAEEPASDAEEAAAPVPAASPSSSPRSASTSPRRRPPLQVAPSPQAPAPPELAGAGAGPAPELSGPLQLGDIVRLGPNAPPEHRHCPAIVSKVAEAHCTVVVLDGSGCSGCGECWPCFEDVELIDTALRVGSRVVISGMQGSKTAQLNGRAGSIVPHPRQGHPAFVCKPSAPDPQLVVCVKLELPVPGGGRTVLVEPRFLKPYEEYDRCVEKLTEQLAETLNSLAVS